SAMVADAVSLLRPQCEHAHTELIAPKPEGAASVSGDSGQLSHLILNLLGNAVEAAGPDGIVEIRLIPCDSKWALEFLDSGPGPPTDVASRLFEPFVTGKPEGIGLGLAVARQIAEAHGGTIAWSRDNDRTCFRVELPVDRELATNQNRQAT